MSYIRSTSNPEGLYIFANMSGIVEFHRFSEHVGDMPQDLFNVLIDSFIENYCEDTEFQKASIKEIFIEGKDRLGGEFNMRLEYEHKWHIDMSYVTWYYIARSNYGRSKPFWKTRLMRRLFGNWV